MITLIVFFMIISFFIFLTKQPVKYSWEDFSKKFGNCTGEFGVYDLTKKTEELASFQISPGKGPPLALHNHSRYMI